MLILLVVGLLIGAPVRAQEARPVVMSSARAGARSIEFETKRVTEADVAISPDGQWLMFTMVGPCFRLPVEGGRAEQLTFGPYSDSDPVFSPSSKRVAFVSDRDD